MCTIVQIVNSQKNIYKKVTPIRPLLPVQTGSQSLILKQSYLNNHKRYISNCWTIVQIVNCQKIFTERWPQIDLYFLSKPEVEKKKYSRGNVLRNFNMVCILSDVNKIDPNLTFRSSRTPSVCQYKHQSLVRCSSYSAKHLLLLFGFFLFFFSFFFFLFGR